MRFDKPDLGFVVHLGAPASPIAYYQQVGRAGRAVERAQVVLLPGAEDEAVWRWFASLAFPPEEQVRTTLAALSDRPVSTAALETRVDLRRTRLETMLKVLDVDGAVRRVRGGWTATGRSWSYDAERYARVAAERAAEQQAMRDYVAAPGCRMEFLRLALDDPQVSGPGSAPCGRCDRCTGTGPDGAVSEAALVAATAALSRPGVVLEPRRLWPTGLKAVGVERSGRIPATEQAEPGRALSRLSDLGWGSRLRTLLASPDGPVPDDVLRAVVAVLAGWSWAQRPEAVVAVPSRARPALVGSLAAEVARIGRLPLLGSLVRLREAAPGGRSNSAQRMRTVADSLAVPDDLRERLPRGPVLLVDDLVDSGWTLTEAARVLRTAGAGHVLSLVLAQEA